MKNTILSFFALYSYVIPISLFVTMELVRLAQGAFLTWDDRMKSTITLDDGETKKVVAMTANNTNLNEELGKVDFIFSDKTGTFTRKEMKLAKWFVDSKIYDEMEDPGCMGRDVQDVSFFFFKKVLKKFFLIKTL